MWNAIDDNCDGSIDEGFDSDSDGFSSCADPVSDCADDNASIYPGADETCNNIDDDCDGTIDEDFPSACSPSITITDPPPYTSGGPSIDPIYNYGKALQMSWYYYEAQRSGKLPKFDGDLPFYDPRTGVKLHDGFFAQGFYRLLQVHIAI